MITFDKARGPIVRFHKIRGLKTIQQFNFNTDESIDYKFSDMVETTRIDLRSDIVPQLGQSDDEPLTVKSPNKQVKTVLYYSGHIFTVYFAGSLIDVYKVNGPLLQTIDL